MDARAQNGVACNHGYTVATKWGEHPSTGARLIDCHCGSGYTMPGLVSTWLLRAGVSKETIRGYVSLIGLVGLPDRWCHFWFPPYTQRK